MTSRGGGHRGTQRGISALCKALIVVVLGLLVIGYERWYNSASDVRPQEQVREPWFSSDAAGQERTRESHSDEGRPPVGPPTAAPGAPGQMGSSASAPPSASRAPASPGPLVTPVQPAPKSEGTPIAAPKPNANQVGSGSSVGSSFIAWLSLTISVASGGLSVIILLMVRTIRSNVDPAGLSEGPTLYGKILELERDLNSAQARDPESVKDKVSKLEDFRREAMQLTGSAFKSLGEQLARINANIEALQTQVIQQGSFNSADAGSSSGPRRQPATGGSSDRSQEELHLATLPNESYEEILDGRRKNVIADYQDGAFHDLSRANEFIMAHNVRGFERDPRAPSDRLVLESSDQPPSELDFWGVNLTEQLPLQTRPRLWAVFPSRRSYQKLASQSSEGGVEFRKHLRGLFVLRAGTAWTIEAAIMRQISEKPLRLELERAGCTEVNPSILGS
jgi:hypothetical protein